MFTQCEQIQQRSYHRRPQTTAISSGFGEWPLEAAGDPGWMQKLGEVDHGILEYRGISPLTSP